MRSFIESRISSCGLCYLRWNIIRPPDLVDSFVEELHLGDDNNRKRIGDDDSDVCGDVGDNSGIHNINSVNDYIFIVNIDN